LYNSIKETFILIIIPQHQSLSYLVEWDLATDKFESIKSDNYYDLDITTMLEHDKEEVFFKKEFWSLDTVSKYKDKMIFNYSVQYVSINNLNLCFSDTLAPNVYKKVLNLKYKECFVGPACGSSYSEIPIFSLEMFDKLKHLYEFDYSLRVVTRPVKYKFLENKQ
jgi:hypothetical protein